MGKCLPFTIDVEMRVYQNKAFPLGIIKANIADYDVWLCNKLINCICYENSDIDAIDDDIWSEKDGLTHTEIDFLKREEFNQKNPDIIAKNKEMLEKGVYITGGYDEFFIPGKSPYQKRHFNHDYVIFGYDEERVFKSAAYMADRSYRFYDITYEDYHNSIAKSEYNFYVCYRKIDKSYVPKVDIVHIQKKLENYLLSREDDYASNRQAYFGMEAWEKFREYVQEIGDGWLDNRYARLYMEHRNIMVNRMRKLNEKGFLNDCSLAEEYHRNVYLPAQAVHHLFIKYNLTRDHKVRQRILGTIQKTNETEERIISRMLERMKMKC